MFLLRESLQYHFTLLKNRSTSAYWVHVLSHKAKLYGESADKNSIYINFTIITLTTQQKILVYLFETQQRQTIMFIM